MRTVPSSSHRGWIAAGLSLGAAAVTLLIPHRLGELASAAARTSGIRSLLERGRISRVQPTSVGWESEAIDVIRADEEK